MAEQNSFAKFFGAIYPSEATVINSAPTYGDAINVLQGTYNPGSGGGVIPSANDVRSGIAVGFGTGNLTLPTQPQVLLGVTFGAQGNEFTGTLQMNSIPNPPASDMCRLKVQVALNGTAVDQAYVKCKVLEANSIVTNNIDPSVTIYEAVTESGYVEIDLYRQTAFSRGSGVYSIQVTHRGQILASVKTAMPDQAEVFLSELIESADPEYTGG